MGFKAGFLGFRPVLYIGNQAPLSDSWEDDPSGDGGVVYDDPCCNAASLHSSREITFKVGSKTYTAAEGMTWKEFIDCWKYKSGNIEVYNDYYRGNIIMEDGADIRCPVTNKTVVPNDVINDGYAYYYWV